MKNKVVTRFAPSPTGLLHAGNYRTAIFSYLYARQQGGTFLLRIEDTDRERSRSEYLANILESLAWLGLDFDNSEQPPQQSQRQNLYRKYLQKLLDEDKAYFSKETNQKEGERAEVIRFRNPNKVVTFHDLIRGEITTETNDLKDFVIAKNLDEPIFHLAVVVDDYEMGITHIIRGEDHISNTPRQILIAEAIGAPIPFYAHLPLLLAPDRTKLSKRKGALALTEYRDQGYLAEAILNYLVLLGWNPGDDQEFFSQAELIEKFDLEKVQKGAAIFDEEKLKWFNREYLKKLSPSDFWTKAKTFLPKTWEHESSEIISKIIPQIRERISTLAEVGEMASQGDLEYYFTAPTNLTKEFLKTTEFLPATIERLESLSNSDFTAEKIKISLWDFATEKGRANVLWPLRVALTGREKSPDPFTVAAILGREETLRRLHYAQEISV